MTAEYLMTKLPAFQADRKLIKRVQSTEDIITEVVDAHKAFAADYDLIADQFNMRSTAEGICALLFEWCKKNMPYQIEKAKRQSSRSPGAILSMREIYGSDCKHYAGWIAGILDGLVRKGRKINWRYRFASYKFGTPKPYHVFVVVKAGDREIWVDPVLATFDQHYPHPIYYKDQKVNTMALERISGVGFQSTITVKRRNAYGNSMGLMVQEDPVMPVDGGVSQVLPPVTVQLPDVPPLPPPPPNEFRNPIPFLRINAYDIYQMGIPFTYKVFANQNLTPACTMQIFLAMNGGKPKPAAPFQPATGVWPWPEVFPISYTVDGEPWPLPSGISKAGDPVEPLPPNLRVSFPTTWMGVDIPADMPRPLVVDGKLRIWPLNIGSGDTNSFLLEKGKVRLNLLMSAIGTLNKCYSPSPYADDLNKLSHYIMDLRDKDDFLYPVDTKTFFGYLLEGAANALKAVVRVGAMFHGFGPRLAFLGLIRINAFSMAYRLFLSANDPERQSSLYKQWYDMGGTVGDLKAAILLGCRQTPFWGGHTKHWIVEAVQDDILDNGYIRPADDAEGIPEGYEIPPDGAPDSPGATVGVIGADDVIYYLVAAGMVIAALAKFLKGIGVSKDTEKVIDDVVNAYDVILAAAGQDPLKLAEQTGRPVQYTDANGKTQTVYPPGYQRPGIMTWIKDNPALAAGTGALLLWAIYELTRKQRRAA